MYTNDVHTFKYSSYNGVVSLRIKGISDYKYTSYPNTT